MRFSRLTQLIRPLGVSVQLAMIYDVNAKVMYAFSPDKADEFPQNGDGHF